MRKLTVILLGAILVLGLSLEDAAARGGRGGGRGGPGGGRNGGANRGGTRGGRGGNNRRNERTEDQKRQRREVRLARVAVARLAYAKREREEAWHTETRARLDDILNRALG